VDLDLEPEDDEEMAVATKCLEKGTTLETNVADFVRLIFDEDTIVRSMKDLDVDTKKMPLGKISKAQIKKGIDALVRLEKEVKKKSPKLALLQDNSNQFYTTIPHYFGESKPPVIANLQMIKAKFDLLNILGDIETAVAMMKKNSKALDPLYAKYSSLDADLELVDQSSKEFKDINEYMEATKTPAGGSGFWGSGVDRSIIDVFRVNRHDEGGRYIEFDKVGNRKLLWHGTNVAVVAAILKGGMRIMPHSGGEFVT
jgi:poly [ADP-ribose] polymerase